MEGPDIDYDDQAAALAAAAASDQEGVGNGDSGQVATSEVPRKRMQCQVKLTYVGQHQIPALA
jgi:hypothetical protein